MEKTQDPVQDESLKSTTTLGDDGIGLLHVDPAEERKIVWKLDCCIAPVMAMFYLLSFLVSHHQHSPETHGELIRHARVGSCQHRY